MSKNSWFEVDKDGLAKILARKDTKFFLVAELVSNAWDEPGSTTVEITLTPETHGQYRLIVTDDNPDGFKDLRDAFTLFAESKKNRDPGQRGRFDLGEKLVLAWSVWGKIFSTTGGIYFKEDGSRHQIRERRERGSQCEMMLRLSKEEYEDICSLVFTLIPPKQIIHTTFNGREILHRTPLCSFKNQLPTEIADAEGNLRRTARITNIEVYECQKGEDAHIYELGIPIVETGDKYHVNIGQKVPLTLERDNVPPAYLRKVRTVVLNNVFDKLKDPEEANASWVRDALEDKDCVPQAAAAVVEKRFGKKAVAFDPSDVEGSKLAVSKGYVVIPGATFSKAAWDKIRESGAIPPAGKVTPSPKAYAISGEQLEYIPKPDWTEGMKTIEHYAKQVARDILNGKAITVKFVNDSKWSFGGTYGPSGELTINLHSRGRNFTESFPDSIVELDDFLIHEFAHERVSDHLSEDYHKECTKLGARLKKAALDNLRFYRKYTSDKGKVAVMTK